ncbi:MAG TPA: lantibiotic dehydratase [Longimicrobium sp.]|nr:lantibiotic dehydratase [Longimicrobium sp.]
MMEPWQEGRAEPAEWLGTRFVCRVSGAPADTVDGLRAAATLDRLARLHQVDAELADRRERLSAVLFAAIGRAGGDKPLRNRLMSLKRELYNLRPGASARVADAVASLPAHEADEVRGFAALLDERVALEQAVRAAYGEETPALRARFRRLLDDADFRKGLMISSRSLYGSLERWGQAAAAGGADLGGKDEKTERGLLRYYTRMAMKATPFSTFCAIIPGAFVDGEEDDGGELIRFHGDPRVKRSYVRINKFIYGLLYDHLRTRPAVRHALRVELNPTLRDQDGRLVYLTAIDAREVFQRLANNEVLELITGTVGGGDRPTLGELIGTLASDPAIEATPEEAEAYLDKLIEIGFLRFHTGIREQDSDWDLPFRALLDGIDDDHARQASRLLARLREVVEAYTDAEVGERERMVEEMHALLKDAIEAMEVPQRLRRDMPFYEDATSAARAEVALTPGVRRTFEAWASWVRVTSRVAWPRGEQATMRHFFDDFYGERGRIPLLVFYEDFYREHFKTHVEKEAKIRAGERDDDLKGYDVGNPFGLDFVKRLGETRDRLGELLRERWQGAPGADEISLTHAEVEEALQGVETTSGVCRSMGSFACLAPSEQPGGDPLLVLQGGSYTTGFGKYFSRFLYMLPDDVQEQVRRENASVTGELLAEICGDAQFNANLHPPLLRWEISYPTGESGNAEEQLKSSEIFVERDPEDVNTLRLVHGPTGSRVVPVDLGFLNPRMRPPLYQLVSRFTPPAMFAPPVPEGPERRPRPQPAAEPSADAANGDAMDGDDAVDGARAVDGGGAGVTVDARAAVDASPDVAAPPADTAAVDAAPVAEAQAGGEAAPDAPAAEAPPPPPPRIQVRPRISYEGSLVLSRRRWMVPMQLFPQREPHESGADFFLRANRWRAEAGIPESVYVRINPSSEPPKPAPGSPVDAAAQAEAEAQQQAVAAAEVPGYEAAAEGAAEAHDEAEAVEPAAAGEAEAGAEGEAKKPAVPRTAGSRDLHKPQFIDFGNPLLVGLLGKMGANVKSFTAVVEERLPAREALPRHGGDAYASELVVQLYFPAGTSGAAAHAAAGQEEHAAAVA